MILCQHSSFHAESDGEKSDTSPRSLPSNPLLLPWVWKSAMVSFSNNFQITISERVQKCSTQSVTIVVTCGPDQATQAISPEVRFNLMLAGGTHEERRSSEADCRSCSLNPGYLEAQITGRRGCFRSTPGRSYSRPGSSRHTLLRTRPFCGPVHETGSTRSG